MDKGGIPRLGAQQCREPPEPDKIGLFSQFLTLMSDSGQELTKIGILFNALA